MKHLPKAKVQSATVMLQHGKSIRKVHNALGISLGSVVKIRDTLKNIIPPPKVGRPTKASKADRVDIARQFDTGKLNSVLEGQQEFLEGDGVKVVAETVRRVLKAEGVKAYVEPKKPILTEEHIEARYKFAKDHLKWTVKEWRNVVFSDEKVFSRIKSSGRRFYYRRPEHKRLLPNRTRKIKQGGGGRLMVWGCITYKGVGDSCSLPEGLDSGTYATILEDYISATLKCYRMVQAQSIFQHDNSSIHTARIVKDFLRKSAFKVLEWPPNSPDLNPIENLWADISRKLEEYPDSPKNLDELWQRFEDIWTNTSIDYLHSLYESMPKRIRSLYENKGGHIAY